MRTLGIYALALTLFWSCFNAEEPSPTQTKKVTTASKARIKTVHGDIILKFSQDIAPLTVARVKYLIKKGFYDGLEFHRVIPNFIVQTGDPTVTGEGGSGKNIPFEKSGITHSAGTVSIVRREGDPNSADSQFFICLKEDKSLDKKYTPFAKVEEGLSVARSIREGDKIITMSLE